MTSTSLLRSLCRSNTALLNQKLGLMDCLVTKHGLTGAKEAFTLQCPIVGASIGQHFRHSMDHTELIALVAENKAKGGGAGLAGDNREPAEIHYDLRVRGGTLEKDMDEARKRIVSVVDVLDGISTSISAPEEEEAEELANYLAHSPVHAQFYLSADEQDESKLPSTVARELGFAAHHAIHHMAMVRVIALESAGLEVKDLPHSFGRAPSTIKHDLDGL